VILAVVGIFNNLFGFTGITAFARYLVAPVMIAWMLYLVIKGFADLPSGVLSASPPVGDLGALPFLSGISLAIGSVMWGNEPDTWRYGRPRFLCSGRCGWARWWPRCSPAGRRSRCRAPPW
jgi:purine-cytosine permease-like protein